jgi:plastocyanin
MKGRVLVFTGAAALLLLAACGDDSGSSSNTTSAPAVSGGGSATTAAAGDSAAGGTIVAKDIAYNPTEITVKVGDTITFKNEDGFAHTFTADDGAFDSGNVDGGGEFQFTPDAAGSIAFHCKIHSNMKGTITVEA